jgi:3-oxoacyl-ACP reductase-like protein
MDVVEAEHGRAYAEGEPCNLYCSLDQLVLDVGIRPAFDLAKLRSFDCWWAWARQRTQRLFCALTK